MIDDQFGAPTGAELLADVTAHAVRSVAIEPELDGTYHVAAAGVTTWHGYARHVIEKARDLRDAYPGQDGGRAASSIDRISRPRPRVPPTPARYAQVQRRVRPDAARLAGRRGPNVTEVLAR